MAKTLRTAELALKRAQIAEMLAGVDAKRRVIVRRGGSTSTTFDEDHAFQAARLDFVDWLQQATPDAIDAAVADLRAELGDDTLVAGDVRGLPLDVVLLISKIELGLLALGEHPAQIAREAAAAAEGDVHE